jgi:hypothetical protein
MLPCPFSGTRFELITLVVIGTDYTGKFNFHTATTSLSTNNKRDWGYDLSYTKFVGALERVGVFPGFPPEKKLTATI